MPKYHCVLDTSALLKKYRRETGSDLIQKLFNREDCAIHILNVTIPEVTAGFARWALNEEIKRTARQPLIDLFVADIRDYNVVVHNITHRNIVETDKVWNSSMGVKPGQRIIEYESKCPHCQKLFQGSSRKNKPRIGPIDALVLSVCRALQRSYGGVCLFCSDGHMVKVASKLRIQTVDPEAITELPF